MAISLRQMRYAIAVAEAAHFGRAAERCHVSQPALSQQIQLLEQSCGTPLFDRLSRSVRPTPFGREFLERARAVVAAAEGLEAFAEGRGGVPNGPIRFGLIPTVAPYLLPDVFPAFRSKLAQLSFSISENKTDALLTGLEEGDVDLALLATEPPADGVRFESVELFEDEFVLATGRDERSHGPLTLQAVDPARFLLLDEGHCLRDQAIDACQLEANRGARTFAATSLSTIVEFVANGQGVTLLPRLSLRKEAADQRVTIHPLADPQAGRMLRLVWREGSPFAETFAAIATVIRDVQRQTVSSA
ncbi:LysR family transcriptional regulator [Devosia pacifica]|uniref:LysR family transcriptional regulator n=1 Tax=Devosia pacifica TaxID=1335967 RepID=A0A918S0L4_9HYPH|nr:hydrogen peroxide-inducible genes activator [Devosia pacifica]GHA15973.1 LysR family transcriptional regulator [Devosia pacifica]